MRRSPSVRLSPVELVGRSCVSTASDPRIASSPLGLSIPPYEFEPEWALATVNEVREEWSPLQRCSPDACASIGYKPIKQDPVNFRSTVFPKSRVGHSLAYSVVKPPLEPLC
jgi:hypothetical protein